MYQVESVLSLVTVPSAIENNLALLDLKEHVSADSLAVVNGGHINVIPILNATRRAKYVSITSGERRGKERITEIKWVRINEESLLVVLSTIGLQIYDSEVADERFHHVCQESCTIDSYTKGCCVVRNSIICVGTNLGTVWMFKGDESNFNFVVIHRFYAHDEAIVCLDGFGNHLVSASDIMMYVWICQRDVTISHYIAVPGLYQKPTTLKVCGLHCLAGYDSGEFCIFELMDDNYYVRTVAHRLKITTIDFSPINYKLITASEDAYVKVWHYNPQKYQVNCIFSLHNEDGPVCGAMFLNLSASAFCVTTVNDLNVRCYQKLLENGEIFTKKDEW